MTALIKSAIRDPLDTAALTDALENLLEAADALLADCGEIRTRKQTWDEPAEYARIHYERDEDNLRRAVGVARAALNAEAGA